MEQFERIPILIASYLKGEISTAEKQELDAWINETEANRSFFMRVTNEQSLSEIMKRVLSIGTDTRLDSTLQALDPESKVIRMGRFGRFKKYMVAASFVLIASSVIYLWNLSSNKKDIAETTTPNINNTDVQPGTEKAVLTLSDGTKITLDNTTNGTIAQQGNTVVLKEDGLLAYNADKRKPETAVLYNTLTTARGEEFRSLVLSDGTKVWLNSVSSIYFPTAFINNERIVEITGEVYFEVAKNPSMPFRVKANGAEVEVLGTHFNINAYTDENSTTTTLLEGSVKVKKGKEQVVIKPGQQTQIIGNAVSVINDADVDAAVAWKNGSLVFNQTDIKTILRQVSRWYDVDIEYKGDIKVPKFYGKIPRTVTLSEVVKILEISSKLQLTIEGKKLTVKQP